MSNRVTLYTTAPAVFDGFSTRQIQAEAGRDNRGMTVRMVSLEPKDCEWQTSRYASGLHAYTTPEDAMRFPSIWQIAPLPKLVDRVSHALALLCDEPPPMDLVQLWLDLDESWVESDEDNLQDWVSNHARLPWSMGITVIEASITLARSPNEGLITDIEREASERCSPLPADWWKV